MKLKKKSFKPPHQYIGSGGEPQWYKPIFFALLILFGIGATLSTILLFKRGEKISLNITIIFTLLLLFLPKFFLEKPLEFYGLKSGDLKRTISLESFGLLLLFSIIFLGANISFPYFAPEVSQLIKEPEVSEVHPGEAIGKAIAPLPIGTFLTIEFFVVLTNTFCEELLFRGLIAGGLLKLKRRFLNFKPNPNSKTPLLRGKSFFEKWSPWIIIFIQAVLFGISHWENLSPLGIKFAPLSLFLGIYSFLFGIVAGWLFWREKSILPAFYLHFAVNFFSVVLSRIIL